MNIETKGNSATVSLEQGEKFYFKGTILTGFPKYDWCFVPPFPRGSPIMRLFYRSYFGMRVVTARQVRVDVPITGYFPRGNFQEVYIPAGQKYFVNARCLVGFSGDIPHIHTHIKLHPVFWCLREHFFTIIHGPGTALLYGQSPFDWRRDSSFETERVMAFNIDRRLTTTTPEPEQSLSMLRNVFSKTVYLRFVDEGETLVLRHHDNAGNAERLSLKDILLHFLTFLKF